MFFHHKYLKYDIKWNEKCGTQENTFHQNVILSKITVKLYHVYGKMYT